MRAVLDVILLVLSFATFLIVIQAVMSWLLTFRVINMQNQAVRSIWGALESITEPVYRPIRKLLPRNMGLDLAPLIILIGIFFVRQVIGYYIYPIVP